MAFATRLLKDDLERLCEPKLKLFLSVDVVGSTAFKQSGPRSHLRPKSGDSTGPDNWLMFLSAFYRDFGNKLRQHLQARISATGVQQDPSKPSITPPELWKALGDELVFVTTLEHEAHLPLLLNAFRHTLNEEIDRAKAGDFPLPISLKGAAWTAGFPVCNAEIPMVSDKPETAGEVIGYDYAGPAIDIGFRLSHHATPRKLIVSAEIAYMLASKGAELLHFLHHGGHLELKGVLGGREYPVFWLDCFRNIDRSWTTEISHSHTEKQDRLFSNEDELISREKTTGPKIRAYLTEWFNSTTGIMVPPFIHNGKGKGLSPDGYPALLELARAELAELYRIESGEKSEPNTQANDMTVSTLKDIDLGTPR